MPSDAISRRRRARDRAASFAINGAGAAVIALIFLILLYLLLVTLPLGQGARLVDAESVPLDPAREHLVSAANGRLWRLPASLTGSTEQLLSSGQGALRITESELQLFALPNRMVAAETGPPTALQTRSMARQEGGAQLFAFNSGRRRALIARLDEAAELQVAAVSTGSASADSPVQWSSLPLAIEAAASAPRVLLDADRARVIVIAAGQFLRWQLPLDGREETIRRGPLPGDVLEVSLSAWGPDYETLQLIDAQQRLWRLDPADPMLRALGGPRQLESASLWLGSENDRRVSYRLSSDGELSVFVPTSGDTLLRTRLESPDRCAAFGVSEDGAQLFCLGERSLQRHSLHNPFPETGWASLWKRQWYGGYEQPTLTWQPDGTAIGVLSKLSLSPLLWGTFKAALYGMLLAVPMAMGAALYTGYFLAPRVRNRIKPAIEMLEAFPTVVLGFIAGLWLAPLLLDYLLAILLLPLFLLGIPVIAALTHLLLQGISARFQRRPPRIAVLAVLYTAACVLLLWQSKQLEMAFFGATLRDWLWSVFGVSYEQRNALLVGMAMGVAIMPAMFSIMEDAIHAVPRSLSDGSLALGATRWQSLSRVVLPAASPAILSALLIGLARGLGETMIVLLATGNSPLTDASLFSGLRSLSATIAIELPEAGSSSVQFRLLFLAALVLFGLTFLFNTLAELLRQRLRYNYAGL